MPVSRNRFHVSRQFAAGLVCGLAAALLLFSMLSWSDAAGQAALEQRIAKLEAESAGQQDSHVAQILSTMSDRWLRNINDNLSDMADDLDGIRRELDEMNR